MNHRYMNNKDYINYTMHEVLSKYNELNNMMRYISLYI